MGGILEMLSNAFGAIKEVFGFVRQKDAEKNAPEIVQAKKAADEAAALDKTREALAKKDLDELRKEAAE
jgi:hypothetical protein